MKKILIRLAVTILILAIAAYLIYPVAVRQIAAARDDRIIQKYHSRVGKMTTETIRLQLDSAATYNESLPELHPEKLFSGRDVMTVHLYEAPLNTGDGLVGVLTIPGIRLRLPVYHESAENKTTEKLVHIQGSSLPADTTGIHTVLAGPGLLPEKGFAGSIGLTGERMLQDADRLTPGDLMILNVLDRTLVYQIEWVQTIAPEGLSKTDLTAGEEDDLLTLVTEHGERLLMIRGRRIPAAEAVSAIRETDQGKPLPDWLSILILGSPVILLGLIIMTVTERIKRRSYRLPVEWTETEPATETTKKEGEKEHET